MPGWTSTVPAALLGLVAAFKATPGLDGVNVYDGPKVEGTSAREVVVVGFTGERMSHTGAYPEPSSPDVDVQASIAGMAVSPQEEKYTIHNMIAVLNGAAGAGDIAAARARAYELLAACGAALAADPKLGGAVGLASPGAHSLTQDQGPRGATATIMFDVEVSAFTGR
jgi:hypothetical protein